MITIQPFASEPIPLGKQWLNVFSVSAPVVFRSAEHGWEETLRSAKSYNVNGLFTGQIYNPNSTPVQIDVDNSELQTASTSVDIANNITVQRIVEAIQVEAQATVDGGTVSIIQPESLGSKADTSVPAGQLTKILDARPNRTKAIIQVLSENYTVVRFGDSAIDGNRGYALGGSIQSIGETELNTTAAIYAYCDQAAKVSALEVF